MGWAYFNRNAYVPFTLGTGIATGVGMTIVGAVVTPLLSKRSDAPGLTALRVGALVLAAAPLSTFLALGLVMRVTGDGP